MNGANVNVRCRIGHSRSAVNLKGIWPRRVPKARAIHAAGGGLGAFLFFFFFLFVGNLDEAAASAASMQFTALLSSDSRLTFLTV